MASSEEPTLIAPVRNRSTVVAWVAVALAFLGVAVALLAVINQHRQMADLLRQQHEDARESIRVQTGLELIKRFDSPEIRRSRRLLAGSLLKGNAIGADWRLFDFFETVAQYYAQHRIDDDSVYTNFSYYVVYYWEASKQHIFAFRKKADDRTVYADFEELAGKLSEMVAREGNRPVRSLRPTPERVRAFLRDEAEIAP
jgi:hypothetical protein